MSYDTSTDHILPQELFDYFAAKLLEEREGIIEAHLADCPTCTKEARQLYAFSHLWERWTGQTHGAAYRKAVLDTALQQAQAQSPQWRERLQRWHTAWAGKAEAAVRLVLEAPDQAARLITEGIEALISPASAWDFALASAPGRTRSGVERGALRTRGVAPSAPRAPQVQIRVRQTADATQEVHIRVENFPQEQPPPLVVLVPTQGGASPYVTESERPPGTTYLSARFANVALGDYVVAFEPMGPPGA